MLRALWTAILVLAVAAPAASAATLLPPGGRILTGVASGEEVGDFAARAGKRPLVWQHWIQWGRGYEHALRRARSSGTRLMLHLSTAPGQNARGVISPGQIARGEGDRYLAQLGARLAAHGGPVYLRLFGEMNNCDLAYSSHGCDGRRRDADHSPARFKQAWRRAALILRGGPAATIDARLRRLGMPPLRGAPAPELARPSVALLWSPMTGGSPMIPALRPGVFWPGRRYVDWVSTSFYSRYPNFHYLEPFYRAFAVRHRKPFAFGEWAMWGSGDPAFVRRLFAWVRSHPRVRMMIYNQGSAASGPFRLRNFPAAERTLRRALRAPRFLGLSG